MPLPNFLIIGASKCGTTSLHRYLDQHPEVFMCPVKEPCFFLQDTPRVNYEELFAGVRGQRMIGESSPQYLDRASPEVVERIRTCIPDVKLIAVLRQPVDWAYSAYLMYVRDGIETAKSFAEAVDRDRRRAPPSDRYGLLRDGYTSRLSCFLKFFPRDHLLVLTFDELAEDVRSVLGRICGFLGVDPDFSFDLTRAHNVGYVYRYDAARILLQRPNPVRFLLRRLLPASLREQGREWVRRRLARKPSPLDAGLRHEMTQWLADDIEALEGLIGKDLSQWKYGSYAGP